MRGKCKLKSCTVFNFSVFNASCNLYFGCNTKFNFMIKDNKVILSRKNMCIEIPNDKDFERKFSIINMEE